LCWKTALESCPETTVYAGFGQKSKNRGLLGLSELLGFWVFGVFWALCGFGTFWGLEDCAFHQEAQSYRTISEKISKMEDVS